MKSRMQGLICAAAIAYGVLLPTIDAHAANVIYSYSGNNFTIDFSDGIPPPGTYDTTNRVTGFFEVASPFAANMPLTDISGSLLNYSFTDGERTRTLTDSFGIGAFFFQVSTDDFGEFELWAIQLMDKAFADLDLVGEERHVVNSLNNSLTAGTNRDTGFIQRCTAIGIGCVNSGVDMGRNLDSPGVWTMTMSAVPVPAALPLFLSGLLGLGVMARRRKKQLAA